MCLPQANAAESTCTLPGQVMGQASIENTSSLDLCHPLAHCCRCEYAPRFPLTLTYEDAGFFFL